LLREYRDRLSRAEEIAHVRLNPSSVTASFGERSRTVPHESVPPPAVAKQRHEACACGDQVAVWRSRYARIDAGECLRRRCSSRVHLGALSTVQCAGNHLPAIMLWALNAPHLDDLRAFVISTDRTGEFPSPSGKRQLADRLPAWIVEAKHRGEVLRALDRLAATL
jgi:hypothetical protein